MNEEILPNGYKVKNIPGFKRVTQKEFANYINTYPKSYDIGFEGLMINYAQPNTIYFDLETQETFAIFIPTASKGYDKYNECCLWYIKI